jgi:signal peptidase I
MTASTSMVHDSIPMMKSKSYLSWPQLPYFRDARCGNRTDIVVFNWPVDYRSLFL